MQPRALIIGGSVGGLLAANLLLRAGFDVVVFERTAGDLSDRGAGIGTRDELFAVLRRAGVSIDASGMAEVRSRLTLDGGGVIVHEVPLKSVSSAWAHVYQPLRTALPAACYRAGRVIKRVEQHAQVVTAVLADGARERGDLLIGADGMHSTVRKQFLPEIAPRFAGYVSWRGVADETTAPADLRAIIFDHILFFFLDEGMLLTTTMPGLAATGPRRCQFVWFRPVDEEALPSLCTDADGRQHGLSIAPHLIRPELIDGLKASARALLPPALAALVAGIAQPRLQPIFDLEVPKMVFGRVALLGDAAFVARPHVATGVTKAALDAAGLADTIASAQDLDAALADYERNRLPFGSWLVARGRHIGQGVMQATGRARMERVMREYGAGGIVGDEPTAATSTAWIAAT